MEESVPKRASLLSGDGGHGRGRSHGGLKLSEIQNHELLEYAQKTWGKPKDSVFDVEVINHMYGEMLKATPEMRMLLEYSRYLEKYVAPLLLLLLFSPLSIMYSICVSHCCFSPFSFLFRSPPPLLLL
jgi:hypothetical protein